MRFGPLKFMKSEVYILDYAAEPSTRCTENEYSWVRFYENTEEQDYRCRIIGRKERDQKVGQTLKSFFFVANFLNF